MIVLDCWRTQSYPERRSREVQLRRLEQVVSKKEGCLLRVSEVDEMIEGRIVEIVAQSSESTRAWSEQSN